MPKRIRRRRVKGWRKPRNTVCVTRPGVFGNPFTIEQLRELGYRGTDAELAYVCVKAFRNWVSGDREFVDLAVKRDALIARLPELKGKNLACYCPIDQPCHADVLLELANPSLHATKGKSS